MAPCVLNEEQGPKDNGVSLFYTNLCVVLFHLGQLQGLGRTGRRLQVRRTGGQRIVRYSIGCVLYNLTRQELNILTGVFLVAIPKRDPVNPDGDERS